MIVFELVSSLSLHAQQCVASSLCLLVGVRIVTCGLSWQRLSRATKARWMLFVVISHTVIHWKAKIPQLLNLVAHRNLHYHVKVLPFLIYASYPQTDYSSQV